MRLSGRLRKGQTDPLNPHSTSYTVPKELANVDIKNIKVGSLSEFIPNNPVVSSERIRKALKEEILYDKKSKGKGYNFHTHKYPILHIKQPDPKVDRYDIWTVSDQMEYAPILNEDSVEGYFNIDDVSMKDLPQAVKKVRAAAKKFITKNEVK